MMISTALYSPRYDARCSDVTKMCPSLGRSMCLQGFSIAVEISTTMKACVWMAGWNGMVVS